jgi:hypothetical protein
MRLRVSGEILDQFENTVIAQTYSVNAIGDISTRQGGFSNAFDLPLTDRNAEILGFPQDVNTSDRSPYLKVDADLIDIGAVIATGYIKIKSVEKGKVKCNFFSGNSNWFSLIKDKKMTDLDLFRFNHVWDDVVQAASITNEGSDGYIYPLIDYGAFGSNTTLDANTDEMFPASYVSIVLKQIFFDIGWKAEGELLDDPLFQQMILPFSAKELVHSERFVLESVDSIAVNNGVPGPSPQNTTPNFNVPFNAEYNISCNLNISWTGIPTLMTFNFQKNGTTYDSFTSNIDNSGVFNIRFTADVNFFTTTDNIRINITSPDAGNIAVQSPDSELSCQAIKAINQQGDTIDMSQTMPDMSQEDFIKHIFFSFGVIPQVNAFSKTINLGLFKSIKKNIKNAIDWSDKMVNNSNSSIDFTKLLDSYGSTSNLLYSEDDEDTQLKQYRAEVGRGLGDGALEIENEHIENSVDFFESKFTAMINVTSFTNTVYIPQIAFLEYNSDTMEFERTIEPSPKIAILTKNYDVSTLTINQYTDLTITSDTGSSVVTEMPFCWFLKTEFIDEIDALDDSLSFGVSAFPNEIGQNLRDRYLSDYEDILSNMKYIKQEFLLDETDINALDFLTPIYLKRYNAYFYISIVDNYKGSNTPTFVELVKIA